MIEAVQWGGKDDTNRILNWLAQQKVNLDGWLFFDNSIEVATLVGIRKAIPGDWIITTGNGEFYPVKPDVFPAIYEPA